MNREQEDTKEYMKQGEKERSDTKEVKNYNPPSSPLFPYKVTATLMYNPGSGKLIR